MGNTAGKVAYYSGYHKISTPVVNTNVNTNNATTVTTVAETEVNTTSSNSMNASIVTTITTTPIPIPTPQINQVNKPTCTKRSNPYVHPFIVLINTKAPENEIINTLNAFMGPIKAAIDKDGRQLYESVDQLEFLGPVLQLFSHAVNNRYKVVVMWLMNNFVPLQVSYDNNYCYFEALKWGHVDMADLIATHESFYPSLHVLENVLSRGKYDLFKKCMTSPYLRDEMHAYRYTFMYYVDINDHTAINKLLGTIKQKSIDPTTSIDDPIYPNPKLNSISTTLNQVTNTMTEVLNLSTKIKPFITDVEDLTTNGEVTIPPNEMKTDEVNVPSNEMKSDEVNVQLNEVNVQLNEVNVQLNEVNISPNVIKPNEVNLQLNNEVNVLPNEVNVPPNEMKPNEVSIQPDEQTNTNTGTEITSQLKYIDTDLLMSDLSTEDVLHHLVNVGVQTLNPQLKHAALNLLDSVNKKDEQQVNSDTLLTSAPKQTVEPDMTRADIFPNVCLREPYDSECIPTQMVKELTGGDITYARPLKELTGGDITYARPLPVIPEDINETDSGTETDDSTTDEDSLDTVD